jgi:hypothetical protein
MKQYATTLPRQRDIIKPMNKRTALITTSVLTLAAALVCAGCKGTLGTDTVNVSGSVLSGGKLISGGLTVSSNTIGIGGSVATGTSTNSGSVTIGN